MERRRHQADDRRAKNAATGPASNVHIEEAAKHGRSGKTGNTLPDDLQDEEPGLTADATTGTIALTDNVASSPLHTLPKSARSTGVNPRSNSQQHGHGIGAAIANGQPGRELVAAIASLRVKLVDTGDAHPLKGAGAPNNPRGAEPATPRMQADTNEAIAARAIPAMPNLPEQAQGAGLAAASRTRAYIAARGDIEPEANSTDRPETPASKPSASKSASEGPAPLPAAALPAGPMDSTASAISNQSRPQVTEIGITSTTSQPRSDIDGPQDFESLVGKLAEARETAMPHVVRTVLRHDDFGLVNLRFRADEMRLSVSMNSADPGFAPAVQAASAAAQAGLGDTAHHHNARQEQQSFSQSHGQSQTSGAADQRQSDNHAQPRSTEAGGSSPRGHADDAHAEITSENARQSSTGQTRANGIYA
ncbi:MAG: hypothetical protein AB7U34_05540 [Novosphingobium sp.]